MSELFKTIPESIPQKSLDYGKTQYHTTIKAVGGRWYIYKMPSYSLSIIIYWEKAANQRRQNLGTSYDGQWSLE